jgi:hypothetical protein
MMTGTQLGRTSISVTSTEGPAAQQPAPVPVQGIFLKIADFTGSTLRFASLGAFPDTNPLTDLNPTCDIILPVAAPLHLAVCPTSCFVPIAELCW